MRWMGIILSGCLVVLAGEVLSFTVWKLPWTAAYWYWIAEGGLLASALGLGAWLIRDEIPDFNESLFHNHREAVSLYDRNGRLKRMNSTAERLKGYTETERIGKTFEQFYPAEERERVFAKFRKAADGEPQHFETRYIKKDGAVFDAEVSFFPIHSGRKVRGVYAVLKDITDRKRYDEMLLHSEKLAVVGELAAGIAHEIRNPLASLRGFIQLSLESKTLQYGDIMLDELDRIHTITNELLLLGKPKKMFFEEKEIIPMLESIMTLVGTQAIIHNVEIRLQVEPGLSEARILCEETRIKQVFLNILKNAVEAMPGGGTVSVLVSRFGEALSVRIVDEGCGIPKEMQEKIGQAFFSSKEKGTGLGMMVSFNIVELHKGKLVIASEEGVGTSVDIRLPLVL
ncbi:ATP-binding protein [Paenibacillus thermotolerans]|uniref:ATP-binding protein n=1 Tax=Paenibacillus thermotolerans TaxID=3027807 RepID=UPI002368E428|nr:MULTISPECIES: ATP-binding protein [unclassified Paenibacillus]